MQALLVVMSVRPMGLMFLLECKRTLGRRRQQILKAESFSSSSYVGIAPSYTTSVHAMSGHVPALLAYQPLPSGWYGIAMEFETNAVSITKHEVSKYITVGRLTYNSSSSSFTMKVLCMAIYRMFSVEMMVT